MSLSGVEIWVFDTSSVIEVRRLVPAKERNQVFGKLNSHVDSNSLAYPKEVVTELERWSDPSNPDPQYTWAKDNKAKATRHRFTLELVKEVLAKVPGVCDPEKTGGEEADAYVLALATHLIAQGAHVTIVTDDRRDKPNKLSLATAAGLLRIPSVPLKAYLDSKNIWRS